MRELLVNGRSVTVDAPDDMPLLWILRDMLGMTGTKFGCGIAQCGACTVHVGGEPTRSCLLPVAAVGNRPITTIEAIGDTAVGKRVQDAWLAREVVQCGYCQSGQIMSATALLEKIPKAPPMPISTVRCRATSAAAAPTTASAPPSTRRPKQ